jgi:transcriptional antiterminator RfaH
MSTTEIAAPGSGRDWFVIQCHGGKERLAVLNLRRQDFPVFLPLIRTVDRKVGKPVEVLRPLFPGYLFVAFDPRREPWRCINGTLGVKRLVSFTDVPQPVGRAIMSPLVRACDEEGVFSSRRVQEFRPGERVKLSGGPFDDMVGTIEAMAGGDRARLLLDLLGRTARVTVSRDDLQRVA